ncbi:MAG: hypothetical protein WB723_03375 [Candidatus Acidiferrales bacterium]
MTLGQPLIQSHQRITFQRRVELHSKICQNEIKQMADFQVRVGNECCGRLLLPQPIEHTVDDGRLARPDFTRKQHKAFAGLNSVCQFVQSLQGLRGQE